MTIKTQHVRFIAKTTDGLYGHFGYGDTEADALRNLKKAGGEITKTKTKWNYKPKRGYALIVYKYTSDLPFAPNNREALENEADCWVDQSGATNWIRCEVETIRHETNTNRKGK